MYCSYQVVTVFKVDINSTLITYFSFKNHFDLFSFLELDITTRGKYTFKLLEK